MVSFRRPGSLPLRRAALAWAAAGLLSACFEPSPAVGDADDPAMLPTLFRFVGQAAESSRLPARMLEASDKPHAILLWMPNDSAGNPAAPGINDTWFGISVIPAEPRWPLEFAVEFKGPPPPHIADDSKPGGSGLRTALIGLVNKGSDGQSFAFAIGGIMAAPYGRFDPQNLQDNLGALHPYYYRMWSGVRTLETCWTLYRDRPEELAACREEQLEIIRRYGGDLLEKDTASGWSFRFNYPLHMEWPDQFRDWFMGLAEDYLLIYIPDAAALDQARGLYDKDGACGNLRLGYNLRRMRRLSPAYDTTWVTSGPDTLGLVELEPPKPEYDITCLEPDRVEIPLDDRFLVQDPPVFRPR